MSTLELLDNLFQLGTFLAVMVIAGVFVAKNPKNIPLQYLIGMIACFFSGTLFWTIYFAIHDDFPYYFSASELCYMGAYLFMIGLCLLIFREHHSTPMPTNIILTSLFLPACVIGANLWTYLLVGGLWWTLFYAVPLTVIAYLASINLGMLRQIPEKHHLYNFYRVMVAYLILNNGMFVVSSYGLNNLYLCLDALLTVSVVLMFLCLKEEGSR